VSRYQDFPAAAGVDDALVNQLGEIGDADNYGLGEGVETGLEDRRGLATVQVTTCRNVSVGYRTWEGIQYSDEANGATEDQAAAMADFLRTEFCAHVTLMDGTGEGRRALGVRPVLLRRSD
jgi:hypothetical protein